MLIERFLDGKPSHIKPLAQAIRSVIMETHPAIQEEWKWNTLCFQFGRKSLAYFSVKKGKFQVGFWNKRVLSSPLILRDLKFVGYYLIEELSEELLADIAISALETVEAMRG